METNQNKTFFIFVGGQGVPNSNSMLLKTDLESKPDSLLSRLASKTWNRADASSSGIAGMSIDKPIETHPMAEDSPIRDSWQPSMAQMIEALYKRSSDKTQKIPLPHGVHIESVISVLEFYGLPMLVPNDLDGITPDAMRLKARLYLKYRKEYHKFVNRVISHLEGNVQLETRFIIVQYKKNAQRT